MTWPVRRWEDGDAEAVRSFTCYDPLYPFTSEYQDDIRSCYSLTRPEFQAMALVVEDSGRVVGVIVFGPTRNPERWTVRMLAVENDYKQKGVGRDLKNAAMASAAKRGATTMISSVRAGNAPMEALNACLKIPYELDPGLNPHEPYLFYAAPLTPADEVTPCPANGGELGDL